ncbi:MAG: non-homologous end-joining DNA ligase [Thermoanaerobaculia bacterium]|nr:non-homologous end-joining DNA ligase [Thermoanaerobaculia bacterium]
MTDERAAAQEAGSVEVAGVRLTHPDRVLFPGQGVTKRRLAEYYARVGERMLEHLAGRPVTLVRCPRGREEGCFYQKHPTEGLPREIGTVELPEEEGSEEYLLVETVPALVALAQVGTLELHPWGSRSDRPDRPDRMILDLDPGRGVGWRQVVEAATEVRRRLGDHELESFVKTTGGKGVHVVVPLDRRHPWEEVKGFARAVARSLEREEPERYVSKAAKEAREGRVFVDYLRNARGATAVAPYSTRARPGGPVAVPLGWEELAAGEDRPAYDVETAPRRLAALGRDPWGELGGVRQSIRKASRKWAAGFA